MLHVTSRELELLLDSHKRIILAKDPPLNLIELLMLVIHKKKNKDSEGPGGAGEFGLHL